jgi:AcrR family transcriptional regulator
MYICGAKTEEMPQNERKNIILNSALNVFMKKGIKCISMDDIAKELGISKKTLYLFVKDKEDLVDQATDLFCAREDVEIDRITAAHLNAIEESLAIKKWVLSVTNGIHPSVGYDLEKYHPAVSKKMQANRAKNVFKTIHDNIIKGQKEGLYRQELNAEIITKIYIGKMEIFFDENLFPRAKYLISDLYLEAFEYHIRGIASSAGMELLETAIANSKNQKTQFHEK